MTDSDRSPVTDLDRILGLWAQRYHMDARGRLDRALSGGVPPRFVIGRSAEGCLWRFRADLGDELISAIARLAGRERGWSDWEGEAPPPPERLVMMARLLGDGGLAAPSEREAILVTGRLAAETWSFV